MTPTDHPAIVVERVFRLLIAGTWHDIERGSLASPKAVWLKGDASHKTGHPAKRVFIAKTHDGATLVVTYESVQGFLAS